VTQGRRYELTSRAVRDLRHLDLEERRQILAALDRLVANPPPGDIRELQGAREEWRLRVGEWRVRFSPAPSATTIVVLRVTHRRDAYR